MIELAQPSWGLRSGAGTVGSALRLGWGSTSCPCHRGGCGEGRWGCWRGIRGPRGIPRDLVALERGGQWAGEGNFLLESPLPATGGSGVGC